MNVGECEAGWWKEEQGRLSLYRPASPRGYAAAAFAASRRESGVWLAEP